MFKGIDVVYDDRDDLFAEPEKLHEILCFYLFLQNQKREVSEQLEMNSLKPKEVFVGNMSLHKNLSRVLHINHILIDSNLSLRPIFLKKLQEILCFFTCFSLYPQERF